MFKDTKEGTTNYCLRCEMEEHMKEHPRHTCGIITSLEPTNAGQGGSWGNGTIYPIKVFNSIPAKSPSPSGEINYLHVGEMTACGHCEPDKFGTGLRQAEKAYPDFKCTCKCHTPTSPVEEGWDWKREFDEKFSVSDDQLGKSKYGTPTFYPASRIKSFIRSAISRAVGEYEEKMAHKCYEHEQIARKEEIERVVKMIEGMKRCLFESDGEKHSCVQGCDGFVENCKKCHKDTCSNPVCPLGKGKRWNVVDWNAALTALTDKLK